MDLTNRTTAALKIESRSKMRYRGAVSLGKASRSCWMTQAAVGKPDMNHLLRMQLAYDVAKTRAHAGEIDVKPYVPA